MPATEQDLFTLFARLGIAHRTHRHPPVFTVDESRALRGALPGAHCKSLFLKDKAGTFLLVVVEEQRRLDMKALQAVPALAVGRLSFASASELEAVLGVTPGAVTPFGLINAKGRQDLRLVLDRDMLAAGLVNYHPLHNAATTTIAAADLLTFVRHCGLEPLVLDFSAL